MAQTKEEGRKEFSPIRFPCEYRDIKTSPTFSQPSSKKINQIHIPKVKNPKSKISVFLQFLPFLFSAKFFSGCSLIRFVKSKKDIVKVTASIHELKGAVAVVHKVVKGIVSRAAQAKIKVHPVSSP